MPKGKEWSTTETRQLLDLRDAGDSVSLIASKMGKSEQAIMKKLQRLGLKVVHLEKSNGTTTSSELILPKELLTVEEALKVLAAAMVALQQPGLSKTEVLRLRAIVQASTVYQGKFADYVDYRGLEKELCEWRRKYDELAKWQGGLGGKKVVEG